MPDHNHTPLTNRARRMHHTLGELDTDSVADLSLEVFHLADLLLAVAGLLESQSVHIAEQDRRIGILEHRAELAARTAGGVL